MPKQRPPLPLLPLFLLPLFLLFFAGNVLAMQAHAAAPAPQTDPADSVHATLAAMSDEQVRQLLITELQKDVDAEKQSSSLEREISGPSAPLAKILRSLNEETGQSETQLRKLLAGTPNLLPDLYKVFVTL